MTAEASQNQPGSAPMPPPPGGHQQPPEPVGSRSVQLVPFCFWLPTIDAGLPAGGSTGSGLTQPQPPDPTAVGTAIAAQLNRLGWPGAQPLRWAITAVDSSRGLMLEGVAVQEVPSGEGP